MDTARSASAHDGSAAARHRPHPLHRITDPWLEWTDRLLHLLVAVLFIVAAIAMGGYAIVTFVREARHEFVAQVIVFINDLLLVLIILEVFSTVRNYLETGDTSLQPFLYIGIISATRRILAIGAQTTLGEAKTESAFRHLLLDLGVNAVVVLALATALYLFGRHQAATGAADAARERRDPGGQEPDAVG